MIEICATLDGLPLGIELAAARMAAMSAVEVRDRLDRPLPAVDGAGDAPRHLTLRHAVGWSYDLLDDDERALSAHRVGLRRRLRPDGDLRRGEGADEVEILARLDSLVRKSLVVADHAGAAPGTASFETIRQFAEDQLSETGERERLRDRHAKHFGGEATSRWERWNGPGWREAVDWVEIELANLRSAFRWSARRGDLDVATDIAAHAALTGFSVQLFETIGWAEELLAAATEADVGAAPTAVHGGGLCVLRRSRTGGGRPRPSRHRAGGAARLRGVRARVRDLRRGPRRRSTAATSTATWS